MSTAYLPLRFDGDNEFEGNTGRTLVVCTMTESKSPSFLPSLHTYTPQNTGRTLVVCTVQFVTLLI